MKIKTIQWNIGGGKIRSEKSDADKDESYKFENFDYIKNTLYRYKPDIIFLQEIHGTEIDNNQAKSLSNNLDLPFYTVAFYDKSHLDEKKKLGEAIISRFELKNISFDFFINPKIRFIYLDKEVVSHDKGVLSCVAKIDKKEVCLKTLHLFPFRRLDVDPLGNKMKKIKSDFTKKIESDCEKLVIQGDFNYNKITLEEFIPSIIRNNIKEVILNKPTTPKGRFYDHVIYRGLKHIKSEIISELLTDHFPIYSEFEI